MPRAIAASIACFASSACDTAAELLPMAGRYSTFSALTAAVCSRDGISIMQAHMSNLANHTHTSVGSYMYS